MKYYKVFLLSLLLLASARLYSDEQRVTGTELLNEDRESITVDLNEVKEYLKILPKTEAGKLNKKPDKGKLKISKTSDTRISGRKQKAKISSGSSKNLAKSGKTPAVTADLNYKGKKPEKRKISEKPLPLKKESYSDKTIPETEIKKGNGNKISAEPETKLNDAEFRSAQKPKEKKPDIVEQGNLDTIIINPTVEYALKRNFRVLSFSEIEKWGKPRGLEVLEDRTPVTDNLAFFLPKYSAEFRIEGYNRNEIYRLYIDFVRYNGNLKSINSGLKIWGRSKNGKMFLISDINHKALKDAKIFDALIPFELSYPGLFDIIVKEYSDTPGKWGIWDMIISTKKIDLIESIKPARIVKPGGDEVKIFE